MTSYDIVELHSKEAKRGEDEARSMLRKQQETTTNGAKRGIKAIAKGISQQAASPLKYVMRDAYCTDEGREGTITTDPQQIDGVVRRAWVKIDNGNVQDAAATVSIFLVNAAHTFGRPTKQR